MVIVMGNVEHRDGQSGAMQIILLFRFQKKTSLNHSSEGLDIQRIWISSLRGLVRSENSVVEYLWVSLLSCVHNGKYLSKKFIRCEAHVKYEAHQERMPAARSHHSVSHRFIPDALEEDKKCFSGYLCVFILLSSNAIRSVPTRLHRKVSTPGILVGPSAQQEGFWGIWYERYWIFLTDRRIQQEKKKWRIDEGQRITRICKSNNRRPLTNQYFVFVCCFSFLLLQC